VHSKQPRKESNNHKRVFLNHKTCRASWPRRKKVADISDVKRAGLFARLFFFPSLTKEPLLYSCSHLLRFFFLTDTLKQNSQNMPEDQTQGPQTEYKIPGAEAFIVVSSETDATAVAPEGHTQTKEEDQPGTEQDTPLDDKADHSETGKTSRWQRKQEQLRHERERADKAERELAELKSGSHAKPEGEPDVTDYEAYDDYTSALEKWEKSEEAPNQGESTEQSQMSKAMQYAVDDMQDSFDVARKKYEDFDKTISAADAPIPETVWLTVAETENPGEVAYYLATHKDEAAKIAALTGLKQIKAISEVEKKAARQELPKKKQSGAPPPIEPLEGADGAHTKTVAEMSFREKEEFYHKSRKSGLWNG
jgi:hypothetical protein